MAEAPAAPQIAEWLVGLDHRLARLERAMPLPDEARESDAAGLEITEADIRAAYRLLLDRDVDPEGFETYLRRAHAGLKRADLVAELLESTEHARLAAGNLVEVDLGGVIVCVDRTEREFGRTIAQDGVWEAHIVAQLERLLRPGAVFVDIGANVGVMSFQAARAVGPAGKVIAFEPNPENVQRFLQGVRANRVESVVRLLPLAASATNGIFAIRGASNTHLAEAAAGMRLAAAVPADDMLAGESRIDLIKIDIEGHEPHALQGLAGTIEKHRPILVCEFNPRCLKASGDVAPQAFADRLFALSAQLQIIEHDGALVTIESSAALMKLWAERNAEHIARGDLPDGMVHFDLLIDCAAQHP